MPGPARQTVRLTVVSLRSLLTRRVRNIALGGVAATMLVLLVCVGNTINLFLADGIARQREFSIRTSLGATRLALGRLIVVEALLVGVVGVIGALLSCAIVLTIARQVVPVEYASLGLPTVTFRTAVFALVVGSVSVGASAGAALCAHIVMLRGASQSARPGVIASSRLLRLAMLTGQVAIATILLVAAGMLGASYLALFGQQAGFADDLIAVQVLYPDDRTGAPLQDDVDLTIVGLRKVRGVYAVGAVIGSVVDRTSWSGSLIIGAGVVDASPRFVSDDYFLTIGAKLVDGRFLDSRDANRAGVVVNEAFVRRYIPDGKAVGLRVGEGEETEIVGVVGDTFDAALDAPPAPTVLRRLEKPSGCLGDCNWITYLVRTREVAGLEAGARAHVSAMGTGASVVAVDAVQDRLADSVRLRTFATLLMALFAVASTAVAVLGLAGMIALVVLQQTRNIAIRFALGASQAAILRAVLAEIALATAAGVAAGLLVGAGFSGLLRGLMYGVHPGEPRVVSVAGLLILVTAGLVGLLPARRALQIRPTLALKNQND